MSFRQGEGGYSSLLRIHAQFILTRAKTPNAAKMDPTTPRKTLPLVLGGTIGARGP